jgi:hypothetical protein
MLSAIVFAPGMIVLSAIEVWRGSASMWTFYTVGGSLGAGTIMPSSNPYQAKFAIPLVITILGGIMFIMTGIVTLALCCCMHCLGIYMPEEIVAINGGGVATAAPVVQPAPPVMQTTQDYYPAPRAQTREVYYPPRPQINKSQIAFDPFAPTDEPSDPYSRFSSLPYMPTRYNNSVPNPYGSGVMYGNAPARPAAQGSSFAADFFKPNPAYFWK